MARFILRYRGAEPVREEDLSKIRALPATNILDSSSARMMLVEASEPTLREALKDLPNWVLIPEQTVPLPDTREKVLNPPADAGDETP